MKVSVALLFAPVIFTGCASSGPAPEPMASAAQLAGDFEARTLRDPGLQHFLAENLHRGPADTWDFEALSWAAFYFHPALSVARAQWATARATEAVAGVRPNPTLTLSPGYNFTREAGLSPWMPGINFDFLFPTAGKRQQRVAIAQRESEAARLAVLASVWQVRAELRRALADAANAVRRETQLQAQADAQGALVTLLEQRFAVGSIAAPELSAARTARLRAASLAAESHGQVRVARARVAAALGLPVAALAEIPLPTPPAPAPLAPVALAAARSEALRSRADVLLALQKYTSAHAALELEIAQRWPDVHIGPGYQWDQGSNKWTLAVSFELPLFHHNEAAIAAATARRAEAVAQFILAQSQAVAAIDGAVAAQEAAQIQLDHARQLRTEVEQQNARVEQRRALGAADELERQSARLEAASAALVVLDAENAATLAAGQLEDALQLPFSHLAALAAVPPLLPSVHEKND